jgi:hypothetical protein
MSKWTLFIVLDGSVNPISTSLLVSIFDPSKRCPGCKTSKIGFLQMYQLMGFTNVIIVMAKNGHIC